MSTGPRSARPWLVLAGGILAVSWGSILVRLAGAPPLAVGSGRLLLATLLLAPIAYPRLRREAGVLDRRDLVMIALSGAALAVHFAAWITSLQYTTVASSVILVSTNPIFVGLAGHYLLGERAGRRMLLAVAVVLAGSALVGYGDIDLSPRALLGDGLALLGAVGSSAYLLLGRQVRRKLSTWAYVWLCYGIAALLLTAFSVALGQPLVGYPARTYGIVLLLALGPQILGHTSFNYALGHLPALPVTLAMMGEPVGATVLALVVLREIPATLALVGGVLILGGITMAATKSA